MHERNNEMTIGTKITIIKKKDLQTINAVKKVEKKSKQEAARKVVVTVTNWVSDLQQRHQNETKQSFESLFSAPSHTGGI